jgi:hypothetical protein
MKLFSIKAVKATDGGWKYRIPTIKNPFSLVVVTKITKRFATMKCPTAGGVPISG